MIDMPQKYVNVYIDKSVGMIHEQVAAVLQLRTQLQLANELIAEKEQVIERLKQENDNVNTALQSEADKTKTEHEQLNEALRSARGWEDQYNAMKNKISHMDTLTAQLNETKSALLAKNQEVDSLNNQLNKVKNTLNNKLQEIEELKNVPVSKKAINNKIEKPINKVIARKETDDF